MMGSGAEEGGKLHTQAALIPTITD